MPKSVLCSNSTKKFLTDTPDEYGAVCYSVEALRWHNTDSDSYQPYMVCAELRMQDCVKSIFLEMGFEDGENEDDDPRSFEERLVKLQTMIDTLENMKYDMKMANTLMLDENARLKVKADEAKANKETTNEDEVSEDGR